MSGTAIWMVVIWVVGVSYGRRWARPAPPCRCTARCWERRCHDCGMDECGALIPCRRCAAARRRDHRAARKAMDRPATGRARRSAETAAAFRALRRSAAEIAALERELAVPLEDLVADAERQVEIEEALLHPERYRYIGIGELAARPVERARVIRRAPAGALLGPAGSPVTGSPMADDFDRWLGPDDGSIWA